MYIAGPFFNDYQVSVIEKIKSLLTELGVEYFSPKDVNKNIEGEKGNLELRQKIFNDNINAMMMCDSAVAVIDDFDKGTIWEMGFMYGYNVPIIGYTEFKERGMNIMLSQSVVAFCHGVEELRDELKRPSLHS
jgi:nucleoside deoxyribosyltransferase